MTKLIISDSESNSDLYWATHFLAGDPFIYIEAKGKKTIIVSTLEYARAKRQAEVDEVICNTKVGEEGRLRRVAADFLKIPRHKRGICARELCIQHRYGT
jgi:Xaa-Pro aminopeptidase